MRSDEFLYQMVKALGIILDKRTKRKPGKNTEDNSHPGSRWLRPSIRSGSSRVNRLYN